MTPTRPAPSFYVLHGDDHFSLRAEAQVMRARMYDPALGDLNTSVLDGAQVSVNEALSAASVMPFLAERRLVIVEGMLSALFRRGSGKGAKADLDMLTAALPNLPETARLVFLEFEILPDKHPVLRLALEEGQRGFVKEHSPPRDPSDRPNEKDKSRRRWDPGWVARWIAQRAEYYGGRMEPRAAAVLSQMIGQDLYAADSECFKLVTYAGNERSITEADVSALTPYVPEANIFQIVDAIATRNGAQAALLVHRLLENEEPLMLLGMVNRHFRLLIQVREALDLGADVRQVPEVRGDWHARKLSEQARRFSLEQLEAILRNLLETDFAIKSGLVKDILGVDLFLAGMAE